jgi:hypothetical protein
MHTLPPDGALAYSIEALASATGLGRTFLYGEIAERRLIARKGGRRTVILRADAERWLTALAEVRLDASAPTVA